MSKKEQTKTDNIGLETPETSGFDINADEFNLDLEHLKTETESEIESERVSSNSVELLKSKKPQEQETPNDKPIMLTRKEVAEYFGVSHLTVISLVKEYLSLNEKMDYIKVVFVGTRKKMYFDKRAVELIKLRQEEKRKEFIENVFK